MAATSTTAATCAFIFKSTRCTSSRAGSSSSADKCIRTASAAVASTRASLFTMAYTIESDISAIPREDLSWVNSCNRKNLPTRKITARLKMSAYPAPLNTRLKILNLMPSKRKAIIDTSHERLPSRRLKEKPNSRKRGFFRVSGCRWCHIGHVDIVLVIDATAF